MAPFSLAAVAAAAAVGLALGPGGAQGFVVRAPARLRPTAVAMKATKTATSKPAADIPEVLPDVRRPRPIKPVLDGDTEVFCNREVNMQQIRAVGFDMDYTLAQYNLDFELLAYNGAKHKLVETLGYPVGA